MRQIKFRGKRINGKGWAIGNLIHNIVGDKYFICTAESWRKEMWDFNEVDPKTVGQFTDLLDKNHKEIWEGDKGFFDISPSIIKEIKFEDGAVTYWSLFNMGHKFTVTGNIHETL